MIRPLRGEVVLGGMLNTGKPLNDVCILGDSRIANCNYLQSNLQYALDTSWLHWAQALAGVSLNQLGNDGVGGETTGQVLARVGNVIAKRPRVVFLMCGFNDFSQGIAFNTVIDNLSKIIAQLSSAGIYIVYLSNTGYTGGNSNIIAGIAAQDRWAEDYFVNKPLVGRFVDLMLPTTDTTTGSFLTDASYDGIHLSNYGAYLCGSALSQAVVDVFSTLYLPSTPRDNISTSPQTSQVLSNPMFNGTTGSTGTGITGQVAASWTAARTGALTAVMSKITGDESASSQQAVITSTANGEMFTLTSESVTSVTTLGDLMTGAGRIKITGATNLQRVTVRVQNYGALDHLSTWGQASGNTSYNLPNAFTIKPQSMKIPRNGTGTCRLIFELTFSGSGGATVTFERASLTKETP